MATSPITLVGTLYNYKPKPFALVQSLLDDTRFRDTSLKFGQNAFRLASLTTAELDKDASANYDHASQLIGIARRLIRFLRWIPFAGNFTKNILDLNPVLLGLKTLHYMSCIFACICEDVTTLHRLKLTPASFKPSLFEASGRYAAFMEATSGLAIAGFAVKEHSNRFRAMRKNPNASKEALCKEFLALHIAQITFIKWTCEIVGQSFGMDLHSSATLSAAATALSASTGIYTTTLRHISEQAPK